MKILFFAILKLLGYYMNILPFLFLDEISLLKSEQRAVKIPPKQNCADNKRDATIHIYRI